MLRYAITSGEATLVSAHSLLDGRSEAPVYFALLDQVRRLAAAGVDYIQLREKHLTAGELVVLARELLAILENTSTKLLINTRTDIALATGAHGVHLTSTPGQQTPAQIRFLYRSLGLPDPVISKACHTLAEVRAAKRDKANLILFSPIFGKAEIPAAGLDALARACALACLTPVLALGGMTEANTESCLSFGAAGVAGIRLFA